MLVVFPWSLCHFWFVGSFLLSFFSFFFFLNDTATTEIYTLSLHDALPISTARSLRHSARAWSGASRATPRIAPSSPEKRRRPRERFSRGSRFIRRGAPGGMRRGMGRGRRAEALGRRRHAVPRSARLAGKGTQARRLSRQGGGAQFLGHLVRSLPRRDALHATARRQARGQALRGPRGRLRRGRAAGERVPEESPCPFHRAARSRHFRRDGVEGEGAADDSGARSGAAHPLLRGGRSGLGFSIR